jgi:hypothetical protein
VPYQLEIIYVPLYDQASASICQGKKPLVHGIFSRKTASGEEEEFSLKIDVPLDKDGRQGMQALIHIANPFYDSPAMSAVEAAIEAAFLAGIEFGKKARGV